MRRFEAHEQPFFLVGSVRSGTTLLRLLLGHHPRICRCDEVEYIASAIAGRNDWPDVRKYVRGLPHYYDFRTSGFVPDPSLTFPDLARDLFVQLRASDGRELAGATVHNDFDQLPRIWPEALFIHLERDPRDVARSCVAMG
jgi:Sulfotransferase family